MGMKVAKFGGSSLADAAQFKKVREILLSDEDRRIVVPSAPGKRAATDIKVTDLFYQCNRLAASGSDFASAFDTIRARYHGIAQELGLTVDLDGYLDEVSRNIQLGAGADYAASRGEYLNGILLADYLGWDFVDPQQGIFFDEEGRLDSDKTQEKLSALLAGHERAVVPGFYGCDTHGNVKTFSRGGSDITGAIVARAVQADMYENWTDVSGCLMADPRIVRNPETIRYVTYRELRELSYMGASVLHEEAIFPVKDAGIPLVIKNTNAPDDPGTVISEETEPGVAEPLITGIAGKKDFVAIHVKTNHMSSKVGYIRKTLSIFERYRVSIEHIPTGIDSFAVVVQGSDVKDCLYSIVADIKSELEPDEIKIVDRLALISTVGRNMPSRPGTSGRLFGELGHAGINIRMIAQGSEELDIVVGVDVDDFERAIRVIYGAFVDSDDNIITVEKTEGEATNE